MSGFLRKICVFFMVIAACFAGVRIYAASTSSYYYTLNDDGAKVASVPHSWAIGSVTQLSSLPYKPGYGYGGHYTARGCSGTQVIDHTGSVQVSFNANTTLYACWYAYYPPSIVLDDAGGSGGLLYNGGCSNVVRYIYSNNNEVTVTFANHDDWARDYMEVDKSSPYTWRIGCSNNDVVTQMYNLPTRSGYAFGGYYTEQNGSGTQIIDSSGNLINAATVYNTLGNASPTTIYAYWTSNSPTWATVTINDQSATTNSQYSTLYINTNNSLSNCGGYRTGQSCTALNITSFTPPTKTGYTYGGHYTQTNGGGWQWANSSGVIQYSVSGNQTVYAKWTPKVYTVTLNHGSPTNSPAPSTVYLKYGTGWYSNSGATTPIYAMTTVPQKTNYTFGGYWTGQNGTGTRVIDSDGNFLYTTAALTALTSNATIYAYWTAATQNPTWITVTFDDNSPTNYSQYNGGRLRYLYRNTNSAISNCSGYKLSQSCNATTVTHFTPPTKGGYTYGGHYTGSTQWSDASGNILVNLSANTTVTAQWTQNSGTIYTVTLYPNGGTGSNLLIYERQNIGWYRDSGGTYQITSSIFNSTSSGGAGLTQPTYTNHVFNGYWTGKTADGATSCSGTQMIDANGNILASPSYDASQRWYACWVGQQSTVTLNANGGTACATTSVTATYGAQMPTLSCAPTAPTGHHFNGYFDATSGGTQYYYADLSSARNWDKTGAQTLYAQWVANTYIVKYYCDKEEYELGTPAATDTVTYGQTYVVKTRAQVGCSLASGKKFIGWDYGEGNANLWQPGDIITYNYTDDLDVSGYVMDINTVTLNHGSPDNSPAPNTVYYVTSDGWYSDSNATIEATVSPIPVKYGYDFLGYWTTATSGGTQVVDASGQFITTTVTEPTTIYARYSEKTYQIALDDQNATTAGAPTPLYYSISNGWSATSGGTTITQITTAPTKSGYVFNGYWTQTGGNGTKIINSDRTFATVPSAILQAMHDGEIDMLYADWLTVNTVTFSCQNQAGDGSGTPSPATVQIHDGETLTFPSLSNCSWGNAGYSPFLWGYVVNGSFVETHDAGDTITWDSGWGNRTFNVWYAPNYFNYEYSCGAGSGTPPASGNTYYHNGGWTTAANTCTLPANKHFVGWLEPVSNEVWAESTTPTNGWRWPYDVTAAAGGAFVAQYDDDTYTATFTCENNAFSPYVYSGTAPDDITDIAYQQTITLPSPSVCTNNYPDAGWIASPAQEWNYYCVDANNGAALGGGSAGAGSWTWPKQGNCTFQASGGRSIYHIYYYCDDTTSTVSLDQTVDYSNRDTVRPATVAVAGCTAPTGYHFTGWKVGATNTILSPGQYGGNNALWPYAAHTHLRAQWEADTYNLTWGCGDGTGTPSGASFPTSIDYGETLTFPANTVCSAPMGYEFAGWTIDANTTTYQPNGTFVWNLTSGSEINASFTPITYTITYDCNGGTGSPSTQNVTYGGSIQLISTDACTRGGYTANGWDVSGTSPVVNYASEAVVNPWPYAANKTLSVNWTARTYTITYYDEDGTTVLTGLNPTSYTYGTGATINAVPTKAYSVFNGWCTTRNATTGTLSGCQPTTNPHVIGTTETDNKAYYASWSCATGYRKYNYAVDSFLYPSGGGQIPAGSCAPIRYIINCHGNGGNACLEQFNLGQSGTVGTYSFGSSYNTIAINSTGSDISAVPLPVSNNGNVEPVWPFLFTKSPDANYTAFTPWPANGLVSSSVQSGYLSHNYVTFMQAVANESYNNGIDFGRPHYTFDGLWTAADGGNKYIGADGLSPTGGYAFDSQEMANFFTADADVYAHWVPDRYTIMLEAEGYDGTLPAIYETYNTGWAQTSTETPGDWVPLTAEQMAHRAGYTFLGYYSSASGSNATKYINADGTLANGVTATTFGQSTSIFARFEANTYNVTYDCNADGATDYTDTATYDSTYTVLRLSEAGCSVIIGHTFGGWAISGTNLIKSGGDTFTWNYTEPKTLTAQWTPNVYHITFDFNNNYTGGGAQVGTANMYEKYGVGWGVNESGGTGSTSGELWSDTVITLPRYAGHTFVGYYDNTAGTGTQYVGPDAQLPSNRTFVMDKILYAVWSDCTPGNYCDDGQVISCSTATNGKYPYSDAGASSINDCYLTLTTGKRVATAGAGMTNCAANSFSDDTTTNVYYGGTASASHPTTSSCPACSTLGGGLYATSAGGTGSTGCYITTTAGKYVVANTDTAQTTCPVKKYCESATLYWPSVGQIADCPTPDASTMRTTYPDNYYNVSDISISWGSATGATSISKCRAIYFVTNERGKFYHTQIEYNPVTGKYDSGNGVQKYYTVLNPGYYGTEKLYSASYCNSSSTTSLMYYKDAQPCPTGSYCPGLTSMPLCSSGTYETTIGLYSCPVAYPDSAAMSTSIDACYLTTTAGNYVATAGAGETQCAANSFCTGGTVVYYNGTGGITACSTGAASSYSTSAAGSDAATDCYKTVTLNKNGGSGTIQGTSGTDPASVTCYYNTSCPFGSAGGLQQTGYTFTGGWGTSASCSDTTTSYTVPNGTNTYYACKSQKDYTMQYLCSDGTESANWSFAGTAPVATNPVHYGDSVTMAANPYGDQTGCRKVWGTSGDADYCTDCFTFGGWKIPAEFTSLEQTLVHLGGSDVNTWGNTDSTDWCIIDNTSDACTGFSDAVFYVYPMYTPKQYDIEYMYATSPVNNNASMPADYTYTVGTSISNADQTPPAHATFNGWCTGANGTGTCYNAGQSITIGNRAHGDITYYANWSCGSGYTLTYDTNNQPVCSADVITCDPGYYLQGSSATCQPCLVGDYCEGGNFVHNGTDQGLKVCATEIATGWTSLGGTDCTAKTSCYYPVTLNKNGFSGTIAAGAGTGCTVAAKSTGTNPATLRLFYNTACTLPTFTTGLTQTGYTNATTWSEQSTLNATAVSTIDAVTTTPAVTTYYARKTTCKANYYTPDNTTCTACSGLAGGAYPKSAAGTGDATSCYASITLNKNGYSGTISANAGTGCKVASRAIGTTNATLKLFYNTACTLPTFTTGLTQTGYTNATKWSEFNTIDATTVSTIPASTTAPTITTYYAQKPSCAANYYKNDTTTCSLCSGLGGGLYTKSAAGNKTDNTVCYSTVTAGTYIVNNTDSAVTECPGGSYCIGGNVYWPNVGNIDSCPDGYDLGDAGLSAQNQCQTSCPAGQCLPVAGGSCVDAGVGNWSAGGLVGYGSTLACNVCPTGLTTIGYGAGADEADDCGRVLHMGENRLYLRGAFRTTPSLRVKVGDNVFYGNMSTTLKNMSDGINKKLRLKYNGTTYSVYDDSVGE
ncbi:MAG: InlB B-repeat-containing protein [Alphaproteobacteria bacterium]|nr:InlB B-repeat-containing protein [Alphaproteobacteria bacterium]